MERFRCFTIKNGKLIETDTPNEILESRSPNFFARNMKINNPMDICTVCDTKTDGYELFEITHDKKVKYVTH